MAAAEEVLNLFDVYWFEFGIFSAKPEPSSSSSPSSSTFGLKYPVAEIHEKVEEPKLSRLQTLHVRSLSDHCLSSRDSSNSPDSVLQMPKLQTILSGKQVEDFSGPRSTAIGGGGEEESKNRVNGRRRRKRRTTKGSSRSLSELEFEELKGFMDLGFVFSEEDKNSSLGSIIPGLQRLGRKVEEVKVEVGDFVAVSRPYLSEAWEVLDQPKMENSIPLLNWRIGALGNEVDMKDHLRTWAHTVASTVR
ncbi:uncharacterized protein LOC127811767 [Diospyros lotus]|uniref:uncharacterized protein LOC127811767 n=1 Tax=Diospyros lotus TaxID=55363 RepID=UPI002255DE7A|nr:uncharacterized protein LOC127811767 [Diospyros lotus]